VGDTAPVTDSLAERLRHAYEERDLDQLAPLLAEDVTWGDVTHPRGCRNKAEVLATFAAVMSGGVEGEVTELSVGAHGLLCALALRWPEGHERADRLVLFHVYLLRDGLIGEIVPFDERGPAALAAGV